VAVTVEDRAMSTNPDVHPFFRAMLDALIRAGMVVVLVVACFQVFNPFLDLMLWAAILAVTLYPLQRLVAARLGGRGGRAAALLTLLALLLLIAPILLLGMSITQSVEAALEMIKSGSLHVPPPPATVAEWPLVGKPIDALWMKASTDLTALLQSQLPHIREFAVALLGKAAGVGLGLLMFVGALIIAGIVMAHGETGHRSATRIAGRLFGNHKAEHIVMLCTRTIRAVAQGVVGIAFIQMLLIGVAFAWMGIPGAGLLALAVLLFGILQLPVSLITLPAIVYVFAVDGTTVATVAFAIYVFLAGLVDNVLKPLLLARGVSVPMPVILIGALGGMITNGIIGLFIGPVLLAVGYELFWQWVDDVPRPMLPITPVVPVAPVTTPVPPA
jgi:predicted PurR-regulated permease PerM